MATTTMNISLPESLKAFVDERLNREGYGTASEYIRELIRADQKRREDQELERLLVERLQSADERLFDVDDVKRELKKRMARKK